MMTENITCEWYTYNTIENDNTLIFQCHRNEHMRHVIRVHKRDDGWYFYIDEDKFSLQQMHKVPKLADMGEDEYFQLMLVWDYQIPIGLVREVQQIAIGILGDLSLSNENIREIMSIPKTVEY